MHYAAGDVLLLRIRIFPVFLIQIAAAAGILEVGCTVFV